MSKTPGVLLNIQASQLLSRRWTMYVNLSAYLTQIMGTVPVETNLRLKK
jgi:hypothetical protein